MTFKALKYLPLIFLFGCSPHRLIKKDYITMSESPCIDGTILNIDQAGCESFYWGTNKSGETLKIRCVHSSEDSWWTKTSFYAIPNYYESIASNWSLYCSDIYVKMYILPVPVNLNNQQQQE